MTYDATAAHGNTLELGDDGVGAGTQASKTVSTSNQQIIAKAQTAGTAGNSMSFGILVSGNNTAFSYSISATSLVITSATDGSGVATTTVDDAIIAIQDDPIYRTYWELTTGAGNGSGVLVASAASALSGGANGTEVWSEIKGVHNGPNGPGWSPNIVQGMFHHQDTPVKKATYVNIEPATFDIAFDSTDANHLALQTAARTKAKKHFRDTSTEQGAEVLTFYAFVSMVYKGDVNGFNVYSVTLNIDGDVTVA